MAEVKTIKIDVDTKGAVKSVDDLAKSTKNVTGEVKQANASFDETAGNVGKLSPAFGNAINGAKGLLKTFTALIANPLGATIAAIALAATALFKAFTSTKAGGEQLEQFMSGLGAVMDVIRDRILAVGDTITKFFKGDFKGALDSAKKAVSGFGAEVTKEFSKAAQATRILQKVDDEFRRLSVTRAKVNRDLAATKEIITDENASLADKKKALDEVRKAEEKQTQAELKNAQKKLDAIKAKNALSDTSKEDLDKEAAAEAELFRLQEESARNNRTFNKQERTLRKEAEAEQKQQHQDRLARMKEEQQARNEDLKQLKKYQQDASDLFKSEYEKQLRDITEKYDAQIALAKKYNQDTVDLEKAKNKELDDLNAKQVDLTRGGLDLVQTATVKSINTTKAFQEQQKLGLVGVAEVRERIFKREQELDEAKRKAQEDALAATANTLGQVADLFGRQSAAGKAAAVAEATIQTFLSAQKAYQSTVGIPVVGPVLAPINAGLAIAAGIKNIKAINAVQTPDGGGGGGGNLSNSFAGAVPQAPNFNVVGNSGFNQLAQIQQTPMQAYVVSGEVTSAQALDRNRVKNATL
jgi:hypothetical protein